MLRRPDAETRGHLRIRSLSEASEEGYMRDPCFQLNGWSFSCGTFKKGSPFKKTTPSSVHGAVTSTGFSNVPIRIAVTGMGQAGMPGSNGTEQLTVFADGRTSSIDVDCAQQVLLNEPMLGSFAGASEGQQHPEVTAWRRFDIARQDLPSVDLT